MLTLLAILLGLAAAPLLAQAAPAPTAPLAPPPVMREFRGAWVASVSNIDWPSKPGLSVTQQKAEMVALLDKAQALHLNAILFQVRPCADALYESPYEPWSEYLTGAQGLAPSPLYDPLQFAIDEAHKRGIEVHAWFNPFRVRHSGAKSPPSSGSLVHTHPGWVRRYGTELWLDPGNPAARAWSEKVILDVVKRYDIDGVALDDYFYPYPVDDSHGNKIDFPDGPTWKRYRHAGGHASRGDWRRSNIDDFVHRTYDEIKAAKPWVEFGIAPFGIYRPGFPKQIKGFDPYAAIYADSRKWLMKGWVDYFSPQLYWKIEQKAQSFPVLLTWWTAQNPMGRHIWPSLFTSGAGKSMSLHELIYQIKTTRGVAGSTGDIHFSMATLAEDRGGITTALSADLYAAPALTPASPWLETGSPPGAPIVGVKADPVSGTQMLTWTAGIGNPPHLWVVQSHIGDAWTTQIFPQSQRMLLLSGVGPKTDAVAISAVDRCGIQSEPTVWER